MYLASTLKLTSIRLTPPAAAAVPWIAPAPAVRVRASRLPPMLAEPAARHTTLPQRPRSVAPVRVLMRNGVPVEAA